MSTLLLLSLLLPTAGAVLLRGDRVACRRAALGVTLGVLSIVGVLAAAFPGGTEPFAATDWLWLSAFVETVNIRFSIALDGLSIWLYVLSALLMVVAILAGWESVDRQASLYYRMMLLLETGLLGVFVARDIILFYVFFEFTLIPLFFIIGMWGGTQRRQAAVKFFLFTFVGSVFTFLGLLAVVLWVWQHPADGATTGRMTFSIPELTASLGQRPMDPALQFWVFLALLAGFAVKVPMVPLHTWLPLAHVEAPTAGSVLLAGVLLKIGSYGLVRFCLPMLPHAAVQLMPWLLWLSLSGIIYGALIALAQRDIKRLIAYSSISHMGFCTLGLFALNQVSLQGGMLQMLTHGLATGGLFAVVGMIYERYHTRQIAELGGLARRMPRLAICTMLLMLSSIALPGLGGFVAEFLVLLGTFQRGWQTAPADLWLQFRVIGVLGLAGVIFGAWYMLWMYQRVFFGPPVERQSNDSCSDLRLREICCLAPLVVLLLWIGLQPRFFIDRMTPTVNELMAPAIQAAAPSNNTHAIRP